MKRSHFLLIFFIVLFLASSANAYAMSFGPVTKLGRGIVRMVASPFQLFKEVIETTGESEPVWIAPWRGFVVGAGNGLYEMSFQAVAGLADILTFWTPAGKNWGPVIESASFFPQI